MALHGGYPLGLVLSLRKPPQERGLAYHSPNPKKRLESVVDDLDVELTEALGVADHVDGDNLAARDREAEGDAWLSAGRPYDARGSIQERQLCCLGTPGEHIGHRHWAADFL